MFRGKRPRMLLGVALLLLFGLGLGVGCELVVGLDDLRNGQCKANEKNCHDHCVPLDDPETHCADLASCSPCALTHAYSHCVSGQCAFAGCVPGYGDCDSSQAGCETDINHSADHCGSCDHVCTTKNGYPGCSNGQCAIGGCFKGWDDCNLDWRDGCERPLGTDSDCAGCDLACAVGMTCNQNQCR